MVTGLPSPYILYGLRGTSIYVHINAISNDEETMKNTYKATKSISASWQQLLLKWLHWKWYEAEVHRKWAEIEKQWWQSFGSRCGRIYVLQDFLLDACCRCRLIWLDVGARPRKLLQGKHERKWRGGEKEVKRRWKGSEKEVKRKWEGSEKKVSARADTR